MTTPALHVLLLAGVVAERAGGRELAQLVPDHRLGDVHRHVLAAVVDGDGVADHLGDDRGPARPGLDDLLLAGRVQRVHLLQQVVVDERALLQAARHADLPPAAAGAPTTDDQLLGRLGLVTGAALGLAPRRHRVATTGGLALATTERVVDGVHGDATALRAHALPAVAAGLADLDQLGLGVADLADRWRGSRWRRGASRWTAGAGWRSRPPWRPAARSMPAERAILPPWPGRSSTLCTVGADGDVAQRQGVAGPDLRALTALQRVADLSGPWAPGCRPSRRRRSAAGAMRQLRFGSYSMAATLAGTPSLTRLKSMRRYWRLWPPPRWRAVLRP